MEYATREQAQNAVATLSNQNLMGRLVYVREVRTENVESDLEILLKARNRTVRLSLDSSARLQAVEASKVALAPAPAPALALAPVHTAAAAVVATAAVAVPAVWEVETARYTCPTFVS